MQIISKTGTRHTVYPCRNLKCDNVTWHNGSLCLSCYKIACREKSVQHQVKVKSEKINKRKKYPCKNCGELIYTYNSLCRKCYDKARHIQGELRQLAQNKRQADTDARLRKNFKPAVVSVCPSPDSPNQRHYEIIDTEKNIGVCKYCGRIKNYNKLQDKETMDKVYGR